MFYVYIVSNEFANVIYVGVTNDIARRLYEHETGATKGFASKYNVKKLIFYEVYDNIEFAIAREKEIKGWRREKKDKLINTFNPTWNDLKSTLNH